MTAAPGHPAPGHPAAATAQPAMNPAEDASSAEDEAPAVPAPSGHLAHTWEEARQAAFDCAAPIPAGSVPLREALGRTLAADITALQDMPHYASSAMDGPSTVAVPGSLRNPGNASRRTRRASS